MAVCWLSARTCNLLLVIPNPVACLWRTAVRDPLFVFSPARRGGPHATSCLSPDVPTLRRANVPTIFALATALHSRWSAMWPKACHPPFLGFKARPPATERLLNFWQTVTILLDGA